MSSRWSPRAKLARAATASTLAATLALSGCQVSQNTDAGDRRRASPVERETHPAQAPPRSAAQLSFNVADGATQVEVSTPLKVTAAKGRLQQVQVRYAAGVPLPGQLHPAKRSWTAGELLEPGTAYHVHATAVDAHGRTVRKTVSFRTEDLTLDEQTYAAIAPLAGETVGVGMPVIIRFDVPVTDRAAIERRLHVTSSPKTAGSWHWLSDYEVHWRPRVFWRPGTRVRVKADINGVDAGNGIYGQMDRSSSFVVGRSIIAKVNVDRHQMKVFLDGALARTIPISAGKPGFETRGGTKLIIEKFETRRMDAATVGIDKDDPEYYNIPNVRYAMRVTYSGEFLHAAPWSVPDQGSANVSHGCVGMSLANARWLFDMAHRGDVVRFYGSDRPLEYGNGWTDWDMSFREYKAGSALS